MTKSVSLDLLFLMDGFVLCCLQTCNEGFYEKNIKSFLGFKVAKILLLEREEEVSAPSRPDKKVGSESCSASAGSAR